MKTLVSSTFALSLSLAIGAAQAEELSGTLKKVADNGTITLGYRDASVPFSYLGDNSGQPMGYSVELAGKVVERLKSTLGKPELKVKYNLVTSQTRIPLVQNGTVDLECGSTGVTAERQKQVAFSYGFIYVKGQLLTRKDSGIAHFDDLKGKNVVTTAGTTNERYLKNYNAEHKLGMNVVSAKDHGEASRCCNRVARWLSTWTMRCSTANAPSAPAARLGGGRRAAIAGDLQLHGAQGRPAVPCPGQRDPGRAVSLGRDTGHLPALVPAADPAQGAEPGVPHDRGAEGDPREPHQRSGAVSV